jgi:predicted outer membrane protein
MPMRLTRGAAVRRALAYGVAVAMFAAIPLSGAACRGGDRADSRGGGAPASAAVASGRDTAHAIRDTVVSAGDVSADSSATNAVRPAGRWITDANILSLLGVMNSRQIAAADAELQAWHSDSVRAFASSVAGEHAEIQHAVDSVAARIHLAPVAPALAALLAARMQSQIDSMMTFRNGYNGYLDRAFVREQVASHQLMAGEIEQLAGVAEAPELQAVLSSVAARVGAQLTRAKLLQARLSAADSLAAADSAAKRAARVKR